MNTVSKFNYYVPDGNKVIYLNGITSKMFAMQQTEHQRVQELLQDLESFEKQFPSTFKHFKDWGFIVSEDTNEIGILKFRNRQAVFKDRNYLLTINPTLECNFRCWYCYEEHHQGFMTPDTIEKIKKHIHYMVKEEKISSLDLSWFGGEPLLYFNEVVYPISLFAKELCIENNIPFQTNATTNGYLINEKMAQQMKEIGFRHFQITLDGDENRHNKIRNDGGKPSFQRIVNNINLLLHQLDNAILTLRINYDMQTLDISNWNGVFESFDKNIRNRITVSFQRVWQTLESVKGENKKVLELNRLCKKLGYNQHSISNVFQLGCYRKCYADKYYHAEFNYDGKVYRCTARDYSDKYVIGELNDDGKIQWDEKKMAAKYGKAPFENKQCLACKYLPLCMGSCSQKLAEFGENYLEKHCRLKEAEVMPETMILNYYHYLCEHQKDSQAV